MIGHKIRAVCALMLGLVGGMTVTSGSAAEPAQVVDTLHATLLGIMKNGPRLGCAGRVQQLSPVIDASFDGPFIASRVLRKSWASLSGEQQQQFLKVSRDLIVYNYAANFTKFNGETFATQDTIDMPGGLREVRSTLKAADGTAHEFDFVFKLSATGSWGIVNIITDGISNLALWTTQYDSVMQAQGFDALIKQLRDQVAKIKTSCSAA